MKPVTTFFLCAISLFAIISGYAQPLDMDENFFDNSRGWSEKRDEKFTTQIVNGLYSIHNHSEPSSGRFFWIDYPINEQKDFSIEGKIRFVSGTENNGFGITWGSGDVKNNQYVFVSGNQFFKVAKRANDQLEDVVKWTEKKSVIKPSGEFNVMRIEKKGSQISYKINDSVVAEFPHLAFSGTKLGFYLGANMLLEVDYLKVYQYSTIRLIANPINGFKKENLGPNINSEYPDVMPVITASGNKLFFNRKDSPYNVGGGKDDIYVSVRQLDGTWSRAEQLPRPLNNDGHNAVISVSPDENSLLLMNTYNADGSPASSGISVANRKDYGWEIPQTVEIVNYYNRKNQTSSCLSSSKNVLIMSVERDDSYGDADLYVSFESAGKFGEPINMGKVLNTKGNETTPFLAADDRTLYFSSSGHSGYGSNDIFISRRLDDTWQNWSEPENLGPEINSSSWDAYFTIPAKGDFAYMVSDLNSYGKTDIFRVKVPESARPQPIILVSGRVLHGKTNQPLSAEIVYENLGSGKVVGTALSDPASGEYTIALAGGTTYGFLAEKKKFYAVSDFLDLNTTKLFDEVKRDLYLFPIEEGEVIRLNNIFFDTDKSVLRTESTAELKRLILFLQAHPNMTIQLEGHTDSQGNPEYNMRLSQERAAAVLNYLVQNGISAGRLKAQGFGKNRPVASNDNPEGRQKNRRVEFRIVTL
jgi:outer membrane protein OmpA-like peptidoglycan-associated protein